MRGSVRDGGVKENASSPRDKRWTPSQSDAVDVVGGCGYEDECQCIGKHEARNHSKVVVACKCALEVCRAGGDRERQEKVKQKTRSARGSIGTCAPLTWGRRQRLSGFAVLCRCRVESSYNLLCGFQFFIVWLTTPAQAHVTRPTSRPLVNRRHRNTLRAIGAAKGLSPNLMFGWRASRTAKEHRGAAANGRKKMQRKYKKMRCRKSIVI
ncbi:hypothetical protein EDD15DRAFT_284578 [Pisolithus albus]|nr:hypothetical protein EDD15DRAFT_284578 [Pisolithus albus]